MIKKIEKLLEALPHKTRKNIDNVYKVLRGAGYESYLVGGAVRDLILGRPVGDLDLATDAHPETVNRLFKRTIPTGIKHGTVTVLMGGEAFEVTTFRADSDYSDGRRPDQVRYAKTLSEDLSRRDFTVNALSYEPGEKRLVDEHGGLEDLDARLIRTIGKAKERFFEDGLRPIRACRFLATLGFTLDEETRLSLEDPEVQKRTAMIAVERFCDELRKGLKADTVSAMFRALVDSGLLFIFFKPDFGPYLPTSESLFSKLDSLAGSPPIFKFAVFLKGLGLSEAQFESLAFSLKFSGKEVRDLIWSGRFIDFQRSSDTIDGEYSVRCFLSKVKKVYSDKSSDFLGALPESEFVNSGQNRTLDILRNNPLVIKDLKLGGKDLIARGIKGKEIGESLELLLKHVLKSPELNNLDSLWNLLESPD